MKRFGCVFLWSALALSAMPQPLFQRLEFEAASIKANTVLSRETSVEAQPGGRFVAKNATVRLILRFAFDHNLPESGLLREMALFSTTGMPIIGGPSWLGSERFDIQAKSPDTNRPIGQSQIQLMVQSLLEDRFHLKVHHETRMEPAFDLVVVRSGKLKPTDTTATPLQGPRRTPMDATPLGSFSVLGNLNPAGMFYTMYCHGVSLSVFSRAIQNYAGRPVIDKTGLDGLFDITLTFSPQQSLPLADGAVRGQEPTASSPSGDSIFTAIQEQLGLKFESSRGPVDSLVIDDIAKPTEN